MAIPLILSNIAARVISDLILDFLNPDNDRPDVGDTGLLPDTSIGNPPFTGGQCSGQPYRIEWLRDDGIWEDAGISPTGKILDISFVGSEGNSRFYRAFSEGGINPAWSVGTERGGVNGFRAIGADCGNIGDNNNSSPDNIPSGGVPQNGTQPVTGGDDLVEGGLPVLFSPSILAALAGIAANVGAAIAAAQNAATALEAAKALADAVEGIAEALDAYKDIFEKLREYLNKKEKEDDAKKQYLIRQYGTISGDGYLDIVPRPSLDGFNPLMLDFLCSNVPSGIGRFFGLKSYNWFRYQELGSICFLSPTFGVLSIHKIEHVRTSIAIPDLAVGFTYNLGLNKVIKARASLLYTREKQ